MRRRVSLVSLFCSLFLAASVFVPRTSAQDIFVTPVPNAPFSAVVNVERSIVRKDGTLLELKSFRQIGRDTRGRIHNERRILVPASSDGTPQLTHIHLYDPQTRISTQINIAKKTFWTQTMNHPPSTEPPSIRFASPAGANPPNDFTRQEDLGIHEIEGISAHGIREVQTLPADNSDAGKEITITDEYWYSDELRINLIVKYSDPRTGTVTMTVTQINRTEPDAALFEIPEGYTGPGAAAGSNN
jgi:hypothetical protein